ncbi:MAG: thermopsin [Thermoplasmatales archaeon]|nr:MAG: thermopsin [Thermoplasmatales archaeon]
MRRRLAFSLIVVLLTLIMILSMANITINPLPENHQPFNAGSTGAFTSTENLGNSSELKYTTPELNTSAVSIASESNWTSMEGSLLSKLNSLKIPAIAKLPPNFSEKPDRKGTIYLPSYTSAPAPIGVASYGIINQSGKLTPYSYSTRSFDGQISINTASQLYMDGDSFNSFSIQLNAILNNVTIRGNTGYQFWTQNVVDYSTSTHQLTFIDNIWNFSSPTAVMGSNDIVSGNGTVEPGVLYYDIGPTLNISEPFTLNLYLSSSNYGGENTVFFNYSISHKNSQGLNVLQKGSYDRVQFNSTSGSSSGSMVIPEYTVTGTNLSNNGFIPMDAEMILGGEGGGSNAQFSKMNATMSLKYEKSDGTYSNVRSAYDVGSETGETSTDISEYFMGSTAHLHSGPTFVEPLWNITGSKQGYAILNGTISPSNAFLMIGIGNKINNETAQCSPIQENGRFYLYLNPGTYSVEVLMSYHKPVFFNGMILREGKQYSLGNINLEYSVSYGIYTPFYASDNSQIKNISVSGEGTDSNPYVVSGIPLSQGSKAGVPDRMNNVFSEVNDYLYPVFYGVFIQNTTAYTVVQNFSGNNQAPSFQISYDTISLNNLLSSFGVTSSNFLQFVFYDSSNLIIRNNVISGWFSSLTYTNYTEYNIPPIAGLMLWNVTHSLVENNEIESAGSGMLIYNNAEMKSDIYVWNNSFSNYNLIPAGALFGAAPIGLIVASSNNTIYNNEFTSTIPIVSLEGKYGNLYTDGEVKYHNRFNITRESVTSSVTFMEQVLSGSIIDSGYTGGNYYYNYFGNGNTMYNGTGVGFVFNGQGLLNGSINYAYDSAPLTRYYYRTTVSATGLPVSQQGQITGYVDINNDILSVGVSGTSIYLPNGSYTATGIALESRQILLEPLFYLGSVRDSSGAFIVSGPMVNLTLKYSLLYSITVQESGLPQGTLWGFSIPAAGEGFISTGSNISFYIVPGIYEFLPQDAYGYEASNIPVVQVTHPEQNITIDYVYSNQLISTYSVTFAESGLSGGSKWSVNLDGTVESSTSSTITFNNLSGGNYTYSITTPSGYSGIKSGSVSLTHSNVYMEISFQKSSAIPVMLILYIAISLITGFIVGSAVFYMRSKK